MAKPAKKKAAKRVAKVAKVDKPEVPEVAEVVEQQGGGEQGPEQDGAQLTIADLQAIAQVIDMAVRRGAFGAGEASDVGIIYNKLTGFLQVISDQKKAAEGEQ